MPYFGLTDQLIILFCFVVIMIGNQLSPNVLLFLCNAIGQLCQGGLGYSSCTVTVSQTNFAFFALEVLGQFLCKKLVNIYIFCLNNTVLLVTIDLFTTGEDLFVNYMMNIIL